VWQKKGGGAMIRLGRTIPAMPVRDEAVGNLLTSYRWRDE
jgi:hypothetical protein